MKYLIKGKLYDPVKVGDRGDWYEGQTDSVCGDCGSKYGEAHLEGCDIERCPACGLQLYSCDCGLICVVSDDIDDKTLEELKARQKKANLRCEAVIEFNRNRPNGNIFCILSEAHEKMEKQGRRSEYEQMWNRVQKSESYNAALKIIGEYVLLIETTDLDRQM